MPGPPLSPALLCVRGADARKEREREMMSRPRSFDSDNSGSISEKEVAEALSGTGVHASFERADSNGDGQLSYEDRFGCRPVGIKGCVGGLGWGREGWGDGCDRPGQGLD